MNSKIFFDEMRKIIREEVQMALKGLITESNVPRQVQKQQPVKQVKKRPVRDENEPKTLMQLLEETADEMKNPESDKTLYFDSTDAANFGYGDMVRGGKAPIPTTDINDKPVNTDNLTPAVVEALTRDYSELMKAIKEKKKS